MSTRQTEVSSEAERASAPHPSPLWRNYDYMLLWTGQVLSSVGTNVSGLAIPLLVLALTRSPAQAGFAGALRACPSSSWGCPWARSLIAGIANG